MKFEALVAVFGITTASAFLLGMNPKGSAVNVNEHPKISLKEATGEDKKDPIEYPEEPMVFSETS